MITLASVSGLSIKTYNALCNAGFATLEELADLDQKALLHIPMIGKKAIYEITEILTKHGMRLGQRPPFPKYMYYRHLKYLDDLIVHAKDIVRSLEIEREYVRLVSGKDKP